ncbi:ExbD/TolR family protein [Aquisediminimonas sediminicola]|uniref:ExbD/TolR family protein n=1 Tax=Alteraquisediminimonas sediminicola TaxID=2676787 RepID=UPI001C8ED624|nr:biopolymer transporter ExbD [Aquisediminimonas sediminicola]
MGVSVGAEGGSDAPMSDINTTPLVDVMLVMLIIFLITVPVAVKKIPMEVPRVAHQPTVTKAQNVMLSIRGGASGGCEVYWGNQLIDDAAQLQNLAVAKFKNESDKLRPADRQNPDKFPEVHIRADVNTPYKCIGGTVAVMGRSGFFRVGFISEPKGRTTS